MSVQVTLSFTNTEEMLAYFTGKGGNASATVKVETPKAETAVKKETAAPKAEKAKAETPAPTSTPADTATGSPAASSASSSEGSSSVDYPTLQKAVFALANAKGRDAVVGLLKEKFNVNSAKELAAEQYADALAAVTAATE
jgi:hypothetical protein